MALTAENSHIASLMQKTLERQAALARVRLKFSKGQVEKILFNYTEKGTAPAYFELIKVLREYPLNDDNFRIVFTDCLSCVVLLGRELKQFVEVVCDLDWSSRSEELVGLYGTFVLSLVTAHTYHCPRVMACLMKLFKAEAENWEEYPSPEIVNQWSNVHTVIAQIVAFVPMTISLLLQTIIEQFPYYKAGSHVNRAYVHNLIWISKYIPSLREQLLGAILNRIIIMDVNMVEREKNKPQQDTIFDMDAEEIDEVADALDYCMLEVLRWLEDERDPMLGLLCNEFEKVILPTYGTRHIQFLLLYTISISQQCADRTLNNLWLVAAGLKGLGPGALATRRTAASHLAGLLARCVRVPNSRLFHYLRSMAEWCHSYISATQESTATENVNAHGAFNAICHAIFYLVAFKHQQLFSSKENVNFVESLSLPRLVTCALNPLRTCPPAVTRAFSSVTRAQQVVYCQPVIERNARHSLAAHAPLQFDEWFPYDPYSLPRSGKTIWPLCIEYKDWSKVGDESQYSSMKKKLGAEDDDFLMIGTPTQKLASSLSNGVSPGFRTSESILF